MGRAAVRRWPPAPSSVRPSPASSCSCASTRSSPGSVSRCSASPSRRSSTASSTAAAAARRGRRDRPTSRSRCSPTSPSSARRCSPRTPSSTSPSAWSSVVAVVMRRSYWRIVVDAAGEAPHAADAAGHSVHAGALRRHRRRLLARRLRRRRADRRPARLLQHQHHRRARLDRPRAGHLRAVAAGVDRRRSGPVRCPRRPAVPLPDARQLGAVRVLHRPARSSSRWSPSLPGAGRGGTPSALGRPFVRSTD